MPSALTMLLVSMISTRLQKKADEKGLISKNQIGFRKRCRTADHLLTLNVSVKIDMQPSNQICFVDLRKAYDPVPHRGLFDQLRKLGLNVKLLVENLYKRLIARLKLTEKLLNFYIHERRKTR